MVHKGSGVDVRITAALKWARTERDRCEEVGLDESQGAPAMFAHAARAAGFAAAIEILEEVIEPGKHSGQATPDYY